MASGVPANLIPLTGMDFDGTVGGGISAGIISFKLVDSAGLPIAGAPVSFTSRGGSLRNADNATNAYGIAAAEPVLGSQPGQASFTAVAGGLRETFSGFARLRPVQIASFRFHGLWDTRQDRTRRWEPQTDPAAGIKNLWGYTDLTDAARACRLALLHE